MTAVARFDLKMDVDDKNGIAKAAALRGTTMADFVRPAVKEKAQQLLEREARILLSLPTFAAFSTALDTAFTPNPALQKALTQAHQQVRRV